jgi:hypothetical protein
LQDKITAMSTPPPTPLFIPPAAEKSSTPLIAWAAAGAVILGIIAAILLLTHHPAAASNNILPLDPYASNLQFTKLEMSESTSLSGGKSTFLDGHVHNSGSRTVTGATLQVIFSVFGNVSTQRPVQIENVPLTLIRTHQPYIDTEPVSDAPIAPGETREFRLIFEDISQNWDQQLPDIHAVHITTR